MTKEEKNLWKCPACSKVVDYGDQSPGAREALGSGLDRDPGVGKTYCSIMGHDVTMEKVKS